MSSAILPIAVSVFVTANCGQSQSAHACGDETGLSCDTDRDDARYLLKAAVVAIEKDETSALSWFTEQSHGFRTQDLYVYCIGSNHIVSAHPDPKINHTSAAQTLIDANGFHFGDEMLTMAHEGVMSDVTYLWPRLDGYTPSLKHTMYTKVKDQICAVGYYD